MGKVPAVLRYGRHHGICYDHRKVDLLYKLEEADLVHDFTTLPDLPDFVPPKAEPPTDSKLQISQKASKLLVSATTQPPAPGWRSFLSQYRKAQQYKFEQPLLLTDHEKDMRRFLPKRSLGIEHIDFSFEVLIEENDEGLSWPASTRLNCSQWDKDIAHGKLQISKNLLKHLRCTLQDTWTQDHLNNLVTEVLTSKKRHKMQQISPPLTSVDPVSSPLIPSFPALRQGLTFDPASLISLPTESPPRGLAHEGCIQFNQDIPPGFELSEYRPNYFEYDEDEPIDCDAGETSSSTVTKEKKEKDDAPQEHMASNDTAPARSFVSHICVPRLAPYVSGYTFPLPLLPVPLGAPSLFQDEKLHKRTITPDPQLQKMATPPTKSVVFSEKLETIVPNTLHGVNIPFDLKSLTEDIETPEYEPPLPKNVIRSHQMLWKPENLSLLKEVDDEKKELVLEFSVGKYETEDEDSPRLRKASSHIDEAFEKPSYDQLAKKEQEQEYLSHLMPGADKAAISKKRKSFEDIMNATKRQHVIRAGSISKFSASGSLSSFLGTRQEMPTPQLEGSKTPEQHADVLVPGTPDPVINTDWPGKPYIPALEPRRTIFFSSGHIQVYQSLLRYFEAWAGDTLNILYRNLDSPILLSPKHAVMMTTIQALTQRPLPGQGSRGKSPIHDQLAILTLDSALEILNVLVSTPTFAGNDQNTMMSFTAYCENISRSSACQTRPIYIPAGEVDLHSSVAKLVLEHGFRTEEMVFVDDETNWEKFLVKAGMNAFAAQVVLGLLQDDGSGRSWGLRAFVQMDVMEREARFGSMVGRKMLERVSREIESALVRGELI